MSKERAGGAKANLDEAYGAGEYEEYVLRVNRCSKVVKGGRRLSFSAVVVVGDRRGNVGYGLGKANEAADAIRKGGETAKRSMIAVKICKDTIPHESIGRFRGSKVILRPAAPGTGVIAGGGARAVLTLAGVRNVLAKSLGSNDKLNTVCATFNALKVMRTIEESAQLRGK